MRVLTVLTMIAGLLGDNAVAADPLKGNKEITLSGPGGTTVVIGEVSFTPSEVGVRYAIRWRDAAFEDAFLSMRPFKCVMGPDKHWCHVPYPYENRHTVSADDLTDLEYDLLFLSKGAAEYGINMWNGVYYKLSVEGDALVGQLHEMDMDVLSAPPDAGNLRPVHAADLHESAPGDHWLATVRIE